jgi:cytochrome b pre-mRNA-processing protein 3
MFYGRAVAYGRSLDKGDRTELAASLKRNVRPDAGDWPEADALADYTLAAWDHVAGAATGMFADGSFRFERLAMEEAK